MSVSAAAKPFGPRGSFLLTEDRLEALSRLLFTTEHQRPFAVLSGPSGVGKSRLLDELQYQLRQARRTVVRVDLGGLERTELPGAVLAACGMDSRSESPWRTVEELVEGQGLAGDGGVWILDHLDRTVDDMVPAVHRIAQLLDRPEVRGSLIVATGDAGRLGSLLHRAEWPITLHRWTAEDTAAAVELAQDAHPLPQFTPNALRMIAQAAAGSPATTLRMCELALLAAELNGVPVIDADLVREVAQQSAASPMDEFLWTGSADQTLSSLWRD